MATINVTGNFAGKNRFSHVIKVAKAMLTRPGQEKVIGFEFLLHQYPNAPFAALEHFKATIVA